MGPLYLGKMGTFVNFRYINNLAIKMCLESTQQRTACNGHLMKRVVVTNKMDRLTVTAASK